ncbi:MAG: AraC family transcriptional regulator [Wenzhouxiangella sp.]|nr:MAG: AraC family transcriptional regulator [Wenzhouxiangella sp.]
MQKLSDILVPATYLASYLDAPELDNARLESILSQAPIDVSTLSGEQARISLDRLLQTLALIDEISPPGWHIGPTLRLEAAHHGPLGVAMVTAPDLGSALDCLIRFETLRSPWTVLQAKTAESSIDCAGALRIRVLPTLALPAPGDLLMEINLIALAGLVAELAGRHRRRLQTDLPDRYRPWANQLRQALPGNVRFQGHHYQLSLPVELLDQPCLLAEPGLHASALRRCEELLNRDNDNGPTAARVHQQLMALNGRNPGLPAMARRLGLSERTLIRRLDSEDSSYRGLVDRVRQTLARDWLHHTDMPVSRIAELLGYRDPANFGRAFRRWTGISPGALRGRR